MVTIVNGNHDNTPKSKKHDVDRSYERYAVVAFVLARVGSLESPVFSDAAKRPATPMA